MSDRVHFLTGPQAREARLVLVVLGADLHERAEAAHAHAHRLAAHRIRAKIAGLRDFLAAHRGFGVIDQIDERLPELLEQRHPFLLAVRHGVEGVFHLGGEVVVHVGGEVLRQEAADDLADVGRREAPAFDIDVLAVAQRGDDRGVGRRPADAVFFQRLDQRGLREARRRLGEVLSRARSPVSLTRSPSCIGGST